MSVDLDDDQLPVGDSLWGAPTPATNKAPGTEAVTPDTSAPSTRPPRQPGAAVGKLVPQIENYADDEDGDELHDEDDLEDVLDQEEADEEDPEYDAAGDQVPAEAIRAVRAAKTVTTTKATTMKTEKTPKTEKTSKADLIRAEIAKLSANGLVVRPRDVVQALAKRGIVVAPPQVSTALKAFNNGPYKSHTPKADKPATAKVAAKVSKTEAPTAKRAAAKLSSTAKTPQVNEPSLGAVRHAKAFVDVMGSLEAAQTALAAYESLMAG